MMRDRCEEEIREIYTEKCHKDERARAREGKRASEWIVETRNVGDVYGVVASKYVWNGLDGVGEARNTETRGLGRRSRQSCSEMQRDADAEANQPPIDPDAEAKRNNPLERDGHTNAAQRAMEELVCVKHPRDPG
jgi:hypothetical protein